MIQADVKAAHRDSLSADVGMLVRVTRTRLAIQAHRDSLSTDVDISVSVTATR